MLQPSEAEAETMSPAEPEARIEEEGAEENEEPPEGRQAALRLQEQKESRGSPKREQEQRDSSMQAAVDALETVRKRRSLRPRRARG